MMQSSLVFRIGLGTVQFGMDYGIANKRGKIPEEEISELLVSAIQRGIDTLDTASLYGNSEEILGRILEDKKLNFNIVSKSKECNAPGQLRKSLLSSLKKLNKESIYGYLVHDFKNITSNDYLFEEGQDLKQEGLVEKIGISLYHPEELEFLLKKNRAYDIVQVPYNIFDQRFEPYFSLLREKGVEIHTRSAFLQGMFFLSELQLSGDFEKAKKYVGRINKISSETKVSIAQLCLWFVLKNNLVDKAIIGVDSKDHLEQNLITYDCLEFSNKIYEELKSFRIDDEKIILPYLWKNK